MARKALILILLWTVSFCADSGRASDASFYITVGREQMFDGTLSGLQAAYKTFDDALSDPNCVDCSSTDELKFLHAVTRVIMWVAKDDGDPVDSVLELAKEFGITVSTGLFDAIELTYPDYPASKYGNYEMPETTPDVSEIREFTNSSLIPGFLNFVEGAAIPEIDAVLDELGSIKDSPGEPFRIFFHPHETGLAKDLEVDYGEVLILKGLLTILKAQLQFQVAYDVYVDGSDMLIEKLYGNSLSITTDLLDRYPYLLKVLPTPNDPNDGRLILAQARQDLIDGIDAYFIGMAYMLSEGDLQEDDLLYIDPKTYDLGDRVGDMLLALRDSLTEDSPIVQAIRTTRMYDVRDSNSNHVGYLGLVFDALERCKTSWFVFEVDPGSTKESWQIKHVAIDGVEFLAEMEQIYGQGSALLMGTIDREKSSITNARFEYWGQYEGTVDGLSAVMVYSNSDQIKFDLNPIFGSSSRYPDPVDPRDLLPEFDAWNRPLPGTVGEGLGYDSTLGGIAPGMTQYDWQRLANLQPGYLLDLDFVTPWQIILDGHVNDWTYRQIVLTDPEEDLTACPAGADIKDFYMAYGASGVYGAVSFYGPIYDPASGHYYCSYDLYLSYLPDSRSGLDSLKLSIPPSTNWATLYQMTENHGYRVWRIIGDIECAVGSDAIEFKIPFSMLPGSLAGRFVSLDSYWSEGSYPYRAGERINTHIQIGPLGSISGTVTCDPSYQGTPIYVQAYMDPNAPEGSMVAGTVIARPGPYTIEGIGLGWQGYVRAYTSYYDFDQSNIGAGEVAEAVPVFAGRLQTTGIDFHLKAWLGACKEAPTIDLNSPYTGMVFAGDQETWLRFMPDTNGIFLVRLSAPFNWRLAVFDRCGGHRLAESHDPELRFNASAGTDYFIRVSEPSGYGDYALTVSYDGPPVINDLCEGAVEVVLDVNYTSSTVGATDNGTIECGAGDAYDVWYKFTSPRSGVYKLELQDLWGSVAVFDGCKGKRLLWNESPWGPGSLYLNAEAGRTYYIRIAGFRGMTGPYTFTIAYDGPPVLNDSCEEAIQVVPGITYGGSVVGAAEESVWYSFTPDVNGAYAIDCAKDFYGDMVVFRGCNGKKMASTSGYGSQLTFNGTAGVSYFIQICRTYGGQGDYTLMVFFGGEPVDNDLREDAIPIEPNVSYAGSTSGATGLDVSSCGWRDTFDVWYSFSPERNGVFRISLEETDFDAGFTVYQERLPSWLNEFEEVTCYNPSDSASSYFFGRGGTTYYIRIAGTDGQTGDFKLSVVNVYSRAVLSDLTGDSILDFADLSRFLLYWLNTCPQPYWCGDADLDNSGMIDFTDFAVLASEWLASGVP